MDLDAEEVGSESRESSRDLVKVRKRLWLTVMWDLRE